MLQKTTYFLKKDSISKKEIPDLRKVIRFHDKNYYVLSKPLISDQEYDKLFRLLIEAEKKYPDVEREYSPTQRISNSIQENFETHRHIFPMLSLANTYNEKDLLDFDKQVKEALDNQPFEYITELKFDGISVSLTYRNGELIFATTRGNGVEGEDITLNVKTIPSIPLFIKDLESVDLIEIRGEIIMPKQAFEELNRIQDEQGLPHYANTRNAASGSVRQLNTQITKERKLDAYFYQVVTAENSNIKFKSYLDSIAYLQKIGFKTSPYIEKFSSSDIDKLINACTNYKDRFKHPFEIDGLVIKVNNINFQKQLGNTSHHPKWAIAYKFPAEKAKTKILDIKIQVGRTGVLTPVAILEKVKLSGVEISKATLHNQDEIDKKDIRISDTVLIERAGEVIPNVIEVVKEKRLKDSKKYKIPNICPVCGSQAKKLPGEVAIRCLNINCPAQIKRRIQHFCSKDCMDIEGLGVKLINKFVDDGIFKNFVDIYQFRQHALKLSTQKQFGGKSITKLLKSIEESKKRDLWRLINAIGIKFVGKTVAKTIASKINNIFDLKNISEEELLEFNDIGEKIVKSIFEYMNNKDNIEVLHKLKEIGVNTESNLKSTDNKLNGLKFVITGHLNILSRKEAEKLIYQKGGEILSQVSNKTNFLIVGENPGSKLEKAKKLQIKTLNEEEFINLIGEKIDSFKKETISQNSLF